MPDVVRAAAREALGGDDLRHEFAWMSWAGTVWRLEGKARVVYVKRAAHLEAGLGDPLVDLAAGVWTLQYNYGPGHARTFLDSYGWKPMTDSEIEKLRRRYAR